MIRFTLIPSTVISSSSYGASRIVVRVVRRWVIYLVELLGKWLGQMKSLVRVVRRWVILGKWSGQMKSFVCLNFGEAANEKLYLAKIILGK